MAIMDEVKDPLLDKTIAALEAKMDPKMKAGYLQIVNAGMRFLFDQKTHGMVLEKLKASKGKALPMAIVKGTADLMVLLYKASKRKMFIPAVAPASVALMCMIMDLAEHAGMLKVTPDLLANATRVVVPTVLQRFGIDRKMMAKGIEALRAQRDEGAGDIPEEYGAFEGRS